MPGGSAGRRTRTVPLRTSTPTSRCAGPVTSATANTRPVAGSYTGVPVMPSGSMLPHGSRDSGTGSPTLRRHRTFPVRSSRAYSESPSVATSTWSPTTSGSP
jgi:hypothetical protein